MSFIIRWIDLFIFRELSFDNAFKENRSLNSQNSFRSNLIFQLASVTKSLYFFPFVILTILKVKNKKNLLLAAYILLAFPIVEAFVFGTRKQLVELFLIIIITLSVSNKFTLNFKQVFAVSLSSIFLLTISAYILYDRERKISPQGENFYNEILSSRYNDKVKPKGYVIDFFNSPDNPYIFKHYILSILQFGQYYVHGLFEFDHIISMKKPEISYGKHTFYTIPKFYNNLGLFKNVDLRNYTPREYVYITFFGGIYLDFRWLGLIFFSLFGLVQKYVYQKSKSNIIYYPLWIYLLMINVFLLSFNFLRGSGLYPFFGFLIFFALFQIFQYFVNEKSFNT
jgi:hypothetical protein